MSKQGPFTVPSERNFWGHNSTVRHNQDSQHGSTKCSELWLACPLLSADSRGPGWKLWSSPVRSPPGVHSQPTPSLSQRGTDLKELIVFPARRTREPVAGSWPERDSLTRRPKQAGTGVLNGDFPSPKSLHPGTKASRETPGTLAKGRKLSSRAGVLCAAFICKAAMSRTCLVQRHPSHSKGH